MLTKTAETQPQPFPVSRSYDWSLIQAGWLFAMSLAFAAAAVPPLVDQVHYWRPSRLVILTVGEAVLFLYCYSRFRCNLAADSRHVVEALNCPMADGRPASLSSAMLRLSATRENRGFITESDLALFRELVNKEIPTDFDKKAQDLLVK